MPGKVCSHPGKPLDEHLRRVREFAMELAQRNGLVITAEQETAILLHDIAKAHSSFQVKLCRNCPERNHCLSARSRGGNAKLNHAAPSAAFVLAKTQSVIAAEAVRRHHTGLTDILEAEKFWADEFPFRDDGRGILDILESLESWDGADQLIDEPFKRWIDYFSDEAEWLEQVFDAFDELSQCKLGRLESEWLKLKLLYSLLVAADRWEAAAGKLPSVVPLTLDKAALQAYLDKKRESGLAAWREAVRLEVTNYAKEVLKGPGVYTLTLPTGTGKTIIGLETAMIAAECTGANGILYVLPFVSLVDQNAEVAESFFASVQEDHHLAYDVEDDGEEDNETKRFLAAFRYWLEPVVVTTLAKFWDVIFSPKANLSMSFHRLYRSVIILDEPQSIPARFWEGFGNVLKFLAEELEAIFILMTATQPEIVSGVELAHQPVNFPRIRHTIHWQQERMTIPQAVTFLEEHGLPHKDALIVLNTREAALRAFFELSRRNIHPYFLSRWVTPHDRKAILKAVQEREEHDERRIMVATQVVEAGIDLDFALVFRDLAPFDSIVQVAGRCNRHASRCDMGEVYLAELYHEETGRSFASWVYDNVLLNQTRNIFKENPSFSERDTAALVAKYYRAVRAAINPDSLWQSLCEGTWSKYFELFPERPLQEEMLVIDKDGNLRSQVKRLFSLKDGLASLEEKRNIFRNLSQHSISVPLKHLEEWQDRSSGFILDESKQPIERMGKGIWLVNPEGFGRIYSSERGFAPVFLVDEFEDD